MLNHEQEVAAFANDPYIFLLAGAGSGKTRVIVERIHFLIKIYQKPKSILAITFTKKAAFEMKKRIAHDDVTVVTFHEYCFKLLHLDEHQILGEDHPFSQEDLLTFSLYKTKLKKGLPPLRFKKYQHYLTEHKLMDFDDMLLEALPYINMHTFEYIFIDEFQDTNMLQYHLLKAMLKKEVSCFAVGDPDQSIYAFRGANLNVIHTYIKDYQAKVYQLTLNYRSAHHILSIANKLIAHNPNRFDKKLMPVKEELGTYKLIIDPLLSYDLIVNSLAKMVEQPHDIAILYRFHYQVNGLRQYLAQHYLFDIKLLSMHQAKGLEFECVILWQVEVMPDLRNNQVKDIAEERRLLFVAITRAKSHLLIFARRKSKFINELNKVLS